MGERVPGLADTAPTVEQLARIERLLEDIDNLRKVPLNDAERIAASVKVWGPLNNQGGQLSRSVQYIWPEEAPVSTVDDARPAVVDRDGDAIIEMLIHTGTTVVRQKGGVPEDAGGAGAALMIERLETMYGVIQGSPDICMVDGVRLTALY